MDGNMVLLIIFWVANNVLMYHIGYIRALKEVLKLVEDMHGPIDSGDGVYWKKRYEELVDEFDHAVGPKSFGKEVGRSDAPGETTE